MSRKAMAIRKWNMLPIWRVPKCSEAPVVSVAEAIDTLRVISDYYNFRAGVRGSQLDKLLILRIQVLILIDLEVERGNICEILENSAGRHHQALNVECVIEKQQRLKVFQDLYSFGRSCRKIYRPSFC